MTRVIRFNAFDMNCVAHQSPGLWRHPDDQSWRYKDLSYWTNLATLLERGRFDGLFIADVLGTYDIYGASDEAAIRQAAQIPVADPLLLVSAMALVTEHLGFGVTTGTGFEHPYPFARRLSTLDHLTGGRVGWNVVTGYLPAAARNMGQTDQPAHDARYDHADEYLEVLYKLWEGSWEDDAVVRDAARGVFTDPDKVHHIGHEGTHFTVPGVHLVEPSPQRTPVIYQAGSSPRGVRFAAENAEAVFTAAPTKELLRQTVTTIRRELELAGRDPYSAKIFNLTTVVTGENSEAAHAKHAELLGYGSAEGALVFMSGWMGVDLARYGLDEPIGNVDSNAILSAVAAFQAATADGRVESARYRRVGRDRRDGTAHRRLRHRGGRHPAGVGGGNRCRRLQPGVCDHSGYLRGFHRVRGTGADRAWCLSKLLHPRNIASQAAGPRRPATRGASGRQVSDRWTVIDDHRPAVDGAVLIGFHGASPDARAVVSMHEEQRRTGHVLLGRIAVRGNR